MQEKPGKTTETQMTTKENLQKAWKYQEASPIYETGDSGIQHTHSGTHFFSCFCGFPALSMI